MSQDRTVCILIVIRNVKKVLLTVFTFVCYSGVKCFNFIKLYKITGYRKVAVGKHSSAIFKLKRMALCQQSRTLIIPWSIK